MRPTIPDDVPVYTRARSTTHCTITKTMPTRAWRFRRNWSPAACARSFFLRRRQPMANRNTPHSTKPTHNTPKTPMARTSYSSTARCRLPKAPMACALSPCAILMPPALLPNAARTTNPNRTWCPMCSLRRWANANINLLLATSTRHSTARRYAIMCTWPILAGHTREHWLIVY